LSVMRGIGSRQTGGGIGFVSARLAGPATLLDRSRKAPLAAAEALR